MGFLSEHPNCNFSWYYSCRFRRGHLTGLVLDRHSHTLENHLKQNISLDDTDFLNALDSAFHHLHAFGWVHNDLDLTHVDGSEGARMPVLIDFGSARKIGTSMGTSRDTTGWIEGCIEDSITHDLFALGTMRGWWNSPAFHFKRTR